MYCVISIVFSHLAPVLLIDWKPYSDNVSNIQCSVQLKFLSRHSLQKSTLFFWIKNKSIHQNYCYLYYSSTDHESISTVFHWAQKNFIYNDLVVYAFIIFSWNCRWKTLNVSRDLNSWWHLLLKLPEFKCFQHWRDLRCLLKLKLSLWLLAICSLVVYFWLMHIIAEIFKVFTQDF